MPLNTFFKARELGWMLRHADVSVLLTTARLGNNDLLAHLEEIAPELRDAAPGALRTPALPHLRSVYAFGDSPRAGRCRASRSATSPRDAAIDDALLRAVEACVTPADPMLILYSSGSHRGSEGRHPQPRHRRASLVPARRSCAACGAATVSGRRCRSSGSADWSSRCSARCTPAPAWSPNRSSIRPARSRCSNASASPSAVGWPHFGKALVEHPDFPKRDLSALRSGNIPNLLPPSVCPADPELRPNGLGMTETCGPHTYTGEGALPEERRGCFGAAIAGVEHKVVDPESGRVLGAERDRRDLRARLLADAGPLQARARRDLRRRRLLPHRRRGLLHRGRPALLQGPPRRDDQERPAPT